MPVLPKMFRRLRFGEPIVIVSGLPRSGTSMAMKMLEAGGLKPSMDGVREADEDNPKGYYELEQVKDLDKGGDKSWLRAHRGSVVKIISFLLEHLPEDNNYRIIFMRRNLDEILASQNKMLVRRGEPNETEDDRMKDLYKMHLRRVKYLMENRPGISYMDVPYSEAVSDPALQAARINEFLGGRLNADRMKGVADQDLYRNRASA